MPRNGPFELSQEIPAALTLAHHQIADLRIAADRDPVNGATMHALLDAWEEAPRKESVADHAKEIREFAEEVMTNDDTTEEIVDDLDRLNDALEDFWGDFVSNLTNTTDFETGAQKPMEPITIEKIEKYGAQFAENMRKAFKHSQERRAESLYNERVRQWDIGAGLQGVAFDLEGVTPQKARGTMPERPERPAHMQAPKVTRGRK